MSPLRRVRTPVRIGRLSSEAAAKTTSPSASRRTRASMLVAGASPMAATTGNSSASMPLMLERLLPQVSFSVRSLADRTRSMRWFGSDATRSVRRRAGTVISPSSATLPGTQELIPISRLVAVSLRPELSVFSSTLARTGSVARLLTARLTVWSPRARFSCITETFMPTSRYPLRGSVPPSVLHKNTHPSSPLVGVWTVWTRPMRAILAERARPRRISADPRWTSGRRPGHARRMNVPASVDKAYPVTRRSGADCPHKGRDIHQNGALFHQNLPKSVSPGTRHSE